MNGQESVIYIRDKKKILPPANIQDCSFLLLQINFLYPYKSTKLITGFNYHDA